MFSSLDISTSGLVAQRVRMDTISANIANANTTRDAQGRPNPYQRRFAVFAPGDGHGGNGVHVRTVGQDNREGRLVLDPGHPDTIESGPLAGYVRMPNVDLATEMVNAVEASRSYEANITAMQITKQMYAADLRILA